MIRRLKLKFITLAMTALFILMVVVVAVMNILNYRTIIEESDTILSILSNNRGTFPQFGNEFGDEFVNDFVPRLPPNMSPETPYESRYFTVVIDRNGLVTQADITQIASINRSTAVRYAQQVIEKGGTQGFIGDYRYIANYEETNTRISFLDCGRRLETFRNFLYTSSAVALAGLVVVFAVVFILSGKIIKPIAESYEKQKRFITDAGHEIKTPLTIINANVDILEMELGTTNESLEDIQQQTKRLRSLTDKLVMLARMEEAEKSIPKIEFPISEVVAETVQSFIHLATSQGKRLSCRIQPMLSFVGNDKSIQQLVSILLDNAIKYCPANDEISFTLVKQNRSIYISVLNTTEAEIPAEQLKMVFERFYRTDSSRNSETGGHGIGLSIARAIVGAHNGKIHALSKDKHSFQITAVFPL